MATELPFDQVVTIDKADAEPSFLVDVDGFEGPLDLLLELARRQKVDLAKISVLALAERLRRLEAMRKAAELLVNRPRVGRDMFLRGRPEGVSIIRHSEFTASLFDLLSAYAQQRQTHALSRVTLKRRVVWSLAEARQAIERLAGSISEWTTMDHFLIEYCVAPELQRTARASCFASSLELVREGRIEIRQDRAFAPIWVKGCTGHAAPGAPSTEGQNQAA